MEDKNVKNKEEKNKNVAPIVLIVILLVVLGGFLIYKYIKGNAETNVYYSVIDKLSEGANNITKEFNKKGSYTYDIDFEINGKDAETKKLASVLNKLKLKMDVATDLNKKTIDMSYDINYDNDSLLNVGMFINNNDLYIALKDLYDKNIKIDLGSTFWDQLDMKDSKDLVDEFVKILKRNLKESYITITNETYNDVSVSKEVLDLNSKNLYEFRKGAVTDASNNEKIIDYIYNSYKKSIVNTSLENADFGSLTISKAEIKEMLKTEAKELKEEDINIRIETYINNKNRKLEGLEIIVNDSKLVLEKVEEDKFAIKVTSDKITAEIGTIVISENKVDLDIDFMGVNAKYKVEFDKKSVFGVEYKIAYENISLEAIIRNNTSNGNGTIKAVVDGNEYKINFAFEETKEKINKDLNNYINIDDITEIDYMYITEKLESNKSLAKFIQDMSTIFSVYY